MEPWANPKPPENTSRAESDITIWHLVSPLQFLPHIVNIEHGDTRTTQAPIMIGNRAGTLRSGETPQLSFTESFCCWNKRAGRGTGASPVKWGRGDAFPAPGVGQHAFGQQASTCSHRRGCPRDNNQGRGCTQAHTLVCVYSFTLAVLTPSAVHVWKSSSPQTKYSRFRW